jgi:hypothetical protein
MGYAGKEFIGRASGAHLIKVSCLSHRMLGPSYEILRYEPNALRTLGSQQVQLKVRVNSKQAKLGRG